MHVFFTNQSSSFSETGRGARAGGHLPDRGDRIDLACDLSMTGIIQKYETLAGKALRLIKNSSGKNRWKKM